MNVYDFDHTIFNGDCTIEFWEYELLRHPSLISFFPRQCLYAFKYVCGLVTKEKFKEEFYCFLKKLPNVDKETKEFWDKKEHKFYEWYRERRKPDDLVISASPYFIVIEGCKRIGINNVIASIVDKRTGLYSGKNCRGAEKVRRYREKYGHQRIEMFYSDSKSDCFMMEIAEKAYFVKKGKLKKWNG